MILGRPALADDPRFRTFADRLTHREVLLPIVAGLLRTRTTDAWLADLRAAGAD